MMVPSAMNCVTASEPARTHHPFMGAVLSGFPTPGLGGILAAGLLLGNAFLHHCFDLSRRGCPVLRRAGNRLAPAHLDAWPETLRVASSGFQWCPSSSVRQKRLLHPC